MNVSELAFMQNQLRQMEARVLVELRVLRNVPEYRHDTHMIGKLELMRQNYVSLIEHTVELIEEAQK